jgi:hypothetical protein
MLLRVEGQKTGAVVFILELSVPKIFPIFPMNIASPVAVPGTSWSRKMPGKAASCSCIWYEAGSVFGERWTAVPNVSF